jgi:hypothetical protein
MGNDTELEEYLSEDDKTDFPIAGCIADCFNMMILVHRENDSDDYVDIEEIVSVVKERMVLEVRRILKQEKMSHDCPECWFNNRGCLI